MSNFGAVLEYVQRAESLLQAGRAAEAWLAVAPLRQSMQQHGGALRTYARAAMAVGQVDAAVDALLRAARLENNPPDLIGGVADLLGKVGRYDEALRYWDLLTRLHPELADGHLNRAVTAANANQPEVAVKAADEGLARHPAHPRLLAVRAMALKNAGRIDESVSAFETAVAADPNRALTRYNQAISLRSAFQFEEACEAFAAAGNLGMRGADFDANWAATALEAGRIEEAVGLYERALQADPAHPQSLKNLTRVKIEFLQAEDAFSHYERSTVGRGGSIESWIDWIGALSANYRFEEAAEVGRRGLQQHPGEPALLAFIAFAEGMCGDAAAALGQISQLPERTLEPPATLIGRAQIALRAGEPELAAAFAEKFVAIDPTSQIGWATLSLAWRLTNDPREEWLCDYDRLVMVTDVPPLEGTASPDGYAGAVAAVLDPLHRSRAAPGNQSLRDGTQTAGALFDSRDPAILAFRDAIRAAAERMMPSLPTDNAHPFLSRKSSRLDFSGSWSVRLRPGGGHHVPHFHSLGWMSSAYYARLPEAEPGASERHEGWIQFGAPPAMFELDLPPRRVVEPREGRLVLFPSYMWHGTIPFSAGDRLTAAFDFVPVQG